MSTLEGRTSFLSLRSNSESSFRAHGCYDTVCFLLSEKMSMNYVDSMHS